MKNYLHFIVIISLAFILSNCSDIYYGSPVVNQNLNRHVPRQYFDTLNTRNHFVQANVGRFHTFHTDDNNLGAHVNLGLSYQFGNAILGGSSGLTIGQYEVSNDIVPSFTHGGYQYWSWGGTGYLGYKIAHDDDFEFTLTSLTSFAYQGGEYSDLLNVFDTISTVDIGIFNNSSTLLSVGSGFEMAFRGNENWTIGISPDIGVNIFTAGLNANVHLYLQFHQHTLNLNYSQLYFNILFQNPDYHAMNRSLSASYIYMF